MGNKQNNMGKSHPSKKVFKPVPLRSTASAPALMLQDGGQISPLTPTKAAPFTSRTKLYCIILFYSILFSSPIPFKGLWIPYLSSSESPPNGPNLVSVLRSPLLISILSPPSLVCISCWWARLLPLTLIGTRAVFGTFLWCSSDSLRSLTSFLVTTILKLSLLEMKRWVKVPLLPPSPLEVFLKNPHRRWALSRSAPSDRFELFQ